MLAQPGDRLPNTSKVTIAPAATPGRVLSIAGGGFKPVLWAAEIMFDIEDSREAHISHWACERRVVSRAHGAPAWPAGTALRLASLQALARLRAAAPKLRAGGMDWI